MSVEPPAYWPSSAGEITVEDLVVTYSPESSPALKGISFRLSGGVKVTLVGFLQQDCLGFTNIGRLEEQDQESRRSHYRSYGSLRLPRDALCEALTRLLILVLIDPVQH